jgi:adenine-specific DNA-methyltransferase
VSLVHQIWHGDSAELCAKFKPGRVNCVITDPPFGVDNQSNMAVTEHGVRNARKIANDESPEVAIKTFNKVMDVLLPNTADNSDMYVFTAHQVLEEWLRTCDNLNRHGYRRAGILVWNKDGPGMGDLDGAWGMGHEFIIFLKKGNRPRSANRRSGVFEIPQVRPKDLIHPHEKPVALLDEFIRFSTSPGDFIVDPFGGSGSTVRAAKAAGRSAVAIEYDATNHRIANDRLVTGESALF